MGSFEKTRIEREFSDQRCMVYLVDDQILRAHIHFLGGDEKFGEFLAVMKEVRSTNARAFFYYRAQSLN